MRLLIAITMCGLFSVKCSRKEIPPPPEPPAVFAPALPSLPEPAPPPESVPLPPPPTDTVSPPLQKNPVERLSKFAPEFCKKVLANDRVFMGAHIRLPFKVQTITNENMGNPIVAKRAVKTIEEVAELAPCKHVMNLDPTETVPGMPPLTIRQTAKHRYEVISMIGQFDAVLEFMDTKELFTLVSYREQ